MVGPARFKNADFDVDSGRASGQSEEAPGQGIDAAKDLLGHVSQLASLASLYLATKLDAKKLQIRQAAIGAVLGFLGLIVAAGALVTASVLLLQGAALGLAELLGGRVWAGNLIVGTAVLVVLLVTVMVAMGRFKGASRAATVAKYEQRKRDLQQQYGNDATSRETNVV